MKININIYNIKLPNYKICIYTNNNQLLIEKSNCAHITFNAPYYGLYKIIITNNKPIYIYITKTNCHTFNINLDNQINKIKVILEDQNYKNLKIMKGELILWNTKSQ